MTNKLFLEQWGIFPQSKCKYCFQCALFERMYSISTVSCGWMYYCIFDYHANVDMINNYLLCI